MQENSCDLNAQAAPWFPPWCAVQAGTSPSAPAFLDHQRQSKGQRMDILRIVLAVILPPLGVFLQEGLGKHFWINVLLTILGYIPGIVHAVYIIASREPA
jgi:uncharacterized membrane protein YqaE (UPF0057 family)